MCLVAHSIPVFEFLNVNELSMKRMALGGNEEGEPSFSLKKKVLMVGRVGLEPTANGLKGRCSTIELPTQRSGFAPEAGAK